VRKKNKSPDKRSASKNQKQLEIILTNQVPPMTPNLEPKNLLSMPKPINTAVVDSKKPIHDSESPVKLKKRSESKSKSP
jgi:hypothetical protein